MRHVVRHLSAALLAGVSLAALAQAAAAQQRFECPRRGGDLIFALEARIATLDQHVNPASSRNVTMNIFETLVTRDENMNPLLDLAESVTPSADNAVYTFRIREGVTFHNGKALTSADVLASFQRYQRVGFDRSILEPVTRMEAPDARTFVITLREPRPTFLEAISSFTVPIVIIPAENADAPAQQLPIVGTGPFQFVDRVADTQIRIRRYDGYRPDTRHQQMLGFAGYRQACVDTVTFRMMPEAGARTAALEVGEVHGVEDLPTVAQRRLAGNPNIRISRLDHYALVVGYPNLSQAPTDNVLVRQAMQAALNMEEIMEAATDGAFRLNPSFQFPGQAYYTDAGGNLYNQRNQARARELLARSGYRGERVVLLTNREYSYMYNAALVMSEQLKAVGINAELLVLDWPAALQLSTTNAGWNFFYTGWTSVFAQGGAQSLRNLANPANVHRPPNNQSDDVFMAAFNDITRGATLDERRAAFARAQARAFDQVMAVPFGVMPKAQAVRANVEGFRPYYATRMSNVWIRN
ncbi:MAG: ABC transporter substrate-binding protein [Alphaproteobacteria bacterium]|nr:ABC transporter substrate-binding protein [Alphaproteobacteria bacterium]